MNAGKLRTFVQSYRVFKAFGVRGLTKTGRRACQGPVAGLEYQSLTGDFDGVTTMESRTYIIGRSRTCDLRLTDPTVSGRHAELLLLDGSIHLADLGSTNGTYLLTDQGFKPFKEGYVKPEQKVAFGHYVCSVLQLLQMLQAQNGEHAGQATG